MSLSWESCSVSCSLTWWFDSVLALSHWCKSLPTLAFGLGEVWARPRETSDPVFLDSLLEVFCYPVRSGGLLLAGELPLRYYSGNFALRKPSWSLPDYGGVQALLSAEGSGLVEVPAAICPVGTGCWTKGAGGAWKRMRLTKKTAISLVRRHGVPHVFHGRRWKRLRSLDEASGSGAISGKRGRLSLHEHNFFPRRRGWVIVLGLLHCPLSPGPCLISG